MRIFVGLVFTAGLGLIATAAMMVPEGTGERVSSAVGGYVEAEARDYRDNGAESRSGRRWGRLMDGIYSMQGGILRGAPVDLAAALPPAPQGWVRRDYATADGTRITGTEVRMTGLVSTTTNATLVDFEQAEARRMGARATYVQGDTLVALRMVGDVDRIRAVEDAIHAGAYRPDLAPVSGTIVTLAGVPIVAEPRVDQNLITNEITRVDHGSFVIDLDGMIEIEVLTNGTAEDALVVLSGIDLATLRDALSGADQRLAATD